MNISVSLLYRTDQSGCYPYAGFPFYILNQTDCQLYIELLLLQVTMEMCCEGLEIGAFGVFEWK